LFQAILNAKLVGQIFAYTDSILTQIREVRSKLKIPSLGKRHLLQVQNIKGPPNSVTQIKTIKYFITLDSPIKNNKQINLCQKPNSVKC
jgi:hypothetical protein